MRKRNKLILVLLIAGLLMYTLQVSFTTTYLAIGDNTPDLMLIFTAFIGLRLGPTPGSLAGFAAGFLQDVLIQFYGLHTLCKTVVGFLARFFLNRRVLLIEKYYFPFVVFSLSLFHDAAFYFLQTLGSRLEWAPLFWRLALPNALYNLVAAYLLWMALPQRWIEYVRYDVQYDF
jgi:rod shape-determining protein MreD